MSDTLKIQMTEKQARELYRKTIISDQDPDRERSFIYNCKSEGYIIKSELQQKVEEAEEMLREFNTSAWDMNYYERHFNCIQYFTPKVKQLEETIQALKVDHPEFKK